MKHTASSTNAYIEQEKKQFDSAYSAYSRKRDELLLSPSLKAARAFLDQQFKSTQSVFDRLDKSDERFERAQSAINNEIRRNAFRKFPGLVQLPRLNAEYSAGLTEILHPSHSTGHNTGVLADPELTTGDFNWEVFEPAFELQHSDLNLGDKFEQDESFPWADWGTLGNYVRFSLNHSWTDVSTGSSKYSYNVVGLGLNYKMPRHGALQGVVVLKALDHSVSYQISDNYGPSDADIDVSHIVFISVKSGAETKHLDSVSLLEQSRSSDGDGYSGTWSDVALGTPIIVNFTTGHIHEGIDLQVMVESFFRVASSATCMKTQLYSSVLLKVERIYLRTIE